MAKLVILCGHPADPAAFEGYYADRHIPYAIEHMPNVRGGENMLGALNVRRRPGTLLPVAQMSYDSVAYLRARITSDDGRSTIAGITNFATGGATLLIVDEDE